VGGEWLSTESVTLLTGHIFQRHVFALFTGRSEDELVVDPKGIRGYEVTRLGADDPEVLSAQENQRREKRVRLQEARLRMTQHLVPD